MALSNFGRGRESDSNSSSAGTAAPPSNSRGAGGLTAFIDRGSEFEGKLSFQDSVRIDGKFRGEIDSQSTLIIGESGEIEATIRSGTVVMSGSLEGDIVAKQKVVLHKTAQVHGNIQTPVLVIEEGAVLDGEVKMEGRNGKPAAEPLKPIPGAGIRKGHEGESRPHKT